MHRIIRRVLRSVAVFACVLLLTSGALAEGIEEKLGPRQGDEVAAVAFCLDRGSAELLAEQLEQNGNVGYAAVMADPDMPCIDSRMHYFKPLRITLVERAWTTRAKDGRLFEFWSATDPKGYIGWVWVEVGRNS